MTAEGSNPPGMNELSAKVDRLTEQLESVLSWIQSQSKPPPKAHETPLKERFEDEVSSKDDEEDDRESVHDIKSVHGSHRPFKVEARIDIPTFDGTVDAEKLDSWIDQLETYFTLYGFKSTEKVSFARLKLTSHALAWWNSLLKTQGDEGVGWKEFTRLLRQEFYPMGYAQERWSRWHNLHQQRGQSVQHYTTEFRRLAVSLGISIDNEDVITKYVAGLHQQIQNELRLHALRDISSASRISMAIELKNKNDGAKMKEVVHENTTSKNHMERDNKRSITASNNANNYCTHCQISGHVKEKCWKAHPELFPKKWVKDDRGKSTIATTISNDAVELGQVVGVDKSLTLMVRQNENLSQKEKEELFTLNIQVKKEIVEAIIDTGSEKNLISTCLVQRLGLETTTHPRPYTLGWIQKDVDTKVSRQCKVRFAITNQFIDEVVCEVVPIDICLSYSWKPISLGKRRDLLSTCTRISIGEGWQEVYCQHEQGYKVY